MPGPSHSAREKPCHVFSAPGCAARSNIRRRVCVPASNSSLSVDGSCQEMRSRPGCRMMPPTPNALHWLPPALSASRSHASAALRPSPLTGMLAASPFGGVTIRHRQSSVTTATQLPMRSMGAACRAVSGGPGGPPRCADTPDHAPASATATARADGRARFIVRPPTPAPRSWSDPYKSPRRTSRWSTAPSRTRSVLRSRARGAPP